MGQVPASDVVSPDLPRAHAWPSLAVSRFQLDFQSESQRRTWYVMETL
jgi:hypothetical protein